MKNDNLITKSLETLDMPTKHIDDITWEKIKNEHVRAVILTKSSLKDTDILKLLIRKGLENIKDEDYQRLATLKNEYLFNKYSTFQCCINTVH